MKTTSEEFDGTADENHVTKIPLSNDVKLSKLIRLLNVYGEKLNKSTARRASYVIRHALLTHHSNTFEELAADMDMAIDIDIILNHLNTTVDSLKMVDIGICIQSLQDSLDDLHEGDEEWSVVNNAQRGDNENRIPPPSLYLTVQLIVFIVSISTTIWILKYG